MFKKITLLYFGIVATMLLLLMLLLIIVTLIDISDSENIKTANINLLPKNNLEISTDKNIYAANENILITFKNYGEGKIAQNQNSPLVIKCRPDIGNNYELAFIEYKSNNNWIAIEPVGRCSEDCSKVCSSNQEIKSKDETSFVWSQTILKCQENGLASTSKAPLGIYRVSSAAWDDNTSSFVKIHSDIFKISGISKK